jgi:translation initiation factor 5|mmetsp:Transcript_38757/g.64392  ORF Transcript_38757/g.64392 Transcript_38757/m.64392 type:complete len:399 (-) Transcript_38757:320-1516(-)|eukprot:CAMPEP_0174285728 /NCGR_PEP_ID=MMETSP0809-20121228/9555_1 /TAXON_ID=73025 ORGANISM="Eutreptiella gymnastica-like, Strain CCMP1594" /NCGR_SAMPLE_ID=MMETSP0809 /ASSEMBLY_ACC=CAM_ASM_000658 /LENGTH=398 /DNA_ID=CAMNT_0015381575 /DNA_START=85 /DNA_END=1281 /DNA_ORIENTATION=+
MAMVNVDPEKQADQFYRYKMPRVLIKVEGNGNGIKTVVCNVSEICERLDRPVEYAMRYFASALAATQKLKDDKWILTGSHSQENIQSCTFDFIKKFVLCKACRNPETVIRVDPKKDIQLDCKACSRTTYVPPNEKLCNFIIKTEKPRAEPEDKVIAAATAKEKKEKKQKKEKKDKSRDEREEDKFDKNTRAAGDDEVILSQEEEKTHPVTVLKEFINSEPAPDIEAFVSKVLDIKEEYGLTEDKDVLALVFLSLFDKDIQQQFAPRHKMLSRFVKMDVEKDVIVHLMFLCLEEESLKSKFPILLKKFYDADVITENSITDWYEKKKGPKKMDKDDVAFFKKKAKPFVEWLQQSDSSEEDEESEEEEAPTPAAKPKAAPATAKPTAADDDDSDVDIDAI